MQTYPNDACVSVYMSAYADICLHMRTSHADLSMSDREIILLRLARRTYSRFHLRSNVVCCVRETAYVHWPECKATDCHGVKGDTQ